MIHAGAAGARQKIGLSPVVPIFNEVETITPFPDRVVPIIADQMGRHSPSVTYEVVFVDDGSTDDSVLRLRRHRDANAAIKIVSLPRNVGKDAALIARLTVTPGGWHYLTGVLLLVPTVPRLAFVLGKCWMVRSTQYLNA